MKVSYKGCQIEVTREKCLGGWENLYYSVFDNGFEVTSGFSEGEDTTKDYIGYMKELVDDYKEHPEEYID